MEKYLNRGKYFTRRLSGTETAMGYLIALPAFLFCAVYVSSALVKFVFLSLGKSVNYYTVNTAVNLVDDLLMWLLVVFIMRKFLKRQAVDLKKNFLVTLFSGVVIGYILCVLGNTIGNLLLRFFTSTTTSVNQSAINSLTKQYPLVMIFMTVFLAPVTEELIFRGVVFTSVREHSRVLAYVISALLFGFIHVMDSVLAGNLSEMVQMIPYTVMGLVFCYMYESTNSIYGSILTHMTQNEVAMFFLLQAGM